MKELPGILVLLTCTSGCFFEERGPHHGREAAYEQGHTPCEDCGHVHVGGVWYVREQADPTKY